MSQNTFAQSINSFAAIQYYYKSSTTGSYQLATKNNAGPNFQLWNPTTTGYGAIYRLNASAILPNSLKGSSFTGTGDIYWEVMHDTGIDGGFHCPSVVEITVRPEQGTITSEQSQVKSCILEYQDQAFDRYKISVQSAGNLSASTTINSFYIRIIGTEDKPIFDFTGIPNRTYVGVTLRANINFTMSTDPNTAVFGEINQSITNINNSINEHYEKEQEAIDNIENQQPSDIENTENAATTNLIGVLSGFISAFSNINATNCSLTLEFPNYAGGTRVVDICQGKEKAPRIVEIGSSLLLIGIFVPLAYILIKMIYNEIRSWTNG